MFGGLYDDDYIDSIMARLRNLNMTSDTTKGIDQDSEQKQELISISCLALSVMIPAFVLRQGVEVGDIPCVYKDGEMMFNYKDVVNKLMELEEKQRGPFGQEVDRK